MINIARISSPNCRIATVTSIGSLSTPLAFGLDTHANSLPLS
jgi:hypothetical protein